MIRAGAILPDAIKESIGKYFALTSRTGQLAIPMAAAPIKKYKRLWKKEDASKRRRC